MYKETSEHKATVVFVSTRRVQIYTSPFSSSPTTRNSPSYKKTFRRSSTLVTILITYKEIYRQSKTVVTTSNKKQKHPHNERTVSNAKKHPDTQHSQQRKETSTHPAKVSVSQSNKETSTLSESLTVSQAKKHPDTQ